MDGDARRSRCGRRARTALALLAWLGLALVVNPVGEFPLNDDWSYAMTVRTLVEQGDFRPLGWTSMPLVAQVLWGALFCVPFGFSFLALRLSTLVAGALGIMATRSLLLEAGAGRRAAAVGALVVATNPLYLQLSYTFMTDVPFFAAAVGSVVLLLRSLRRESRAAAVLGIGLAVVATLIRQLGLVVPAGYAVALLVRRGWRPRTLLAGALAVGLPVGALLLYGEWLARTGRLPALYHARLEQLEALLGHGVGAVAIRWGGHLLDALTELGFFAAPLLAAMGLGVWRRLGRGERLVVAGSGAGFALLQGVRLLREGRHIPLSGGILFDLGLGPPSLRDTGILWLPHWPGAPQSVWGSATALGLIGGGLLAGFLLVGVGRAFRRRTGAGRDPRAALLVGASALYLATIAAADYYDRYLLPPLALAAAVVAGRLGASPAVRRLTLAAGLGLVVIQAAFGIGATRDYLNWNRARWDLVRTHVGSGDVPIERLDGGFEVQGWYDYDPAYEETPEKSFWWVRDDEHVLTFGPMEGYRIVDEREFERWIPPGRGRVLLLRRER